LIIIIFFPEYIKIIIKIVKIKHNIKNIIITIQKIFLIIIKFKIPIISEIKDKLKGNPILINKEINVNNQKNILKKKIFLIK
jgi:hypothetical protein